jgi:hypothetical protein
MCQSPKPPRGVDRRGRGTKGVSSVQNHPNWHGFLEDHPELGWEPFVPFAERASWSRRVFDLTVGEGLSRVQVGLMRTHDAIDALMGRLVKAGWMI